MNKTYFVRAEPVSQLFNTGLEQILRDTVIATDTARDGDIVGLDLYLTYNADGMIYFFPFDTVIVREGGKFSTKRWASLAEDHPQRNGIALAFAQLAGKIAGICLQSTLDKMSDDEDTEHFSLGLLAGSVAYLMRNDFQENIIDPLSWEEYELSQDTIDNCLMLLIPDLDSSHARVAILPALSRAQEVILSIQPVVWNDTDPVPFRFDPCPDTAA